MTKAAGNPFFLEELARSTIEAGSHHAALAVPDTIQAVLAARIDRLPPADKQLLQTAAVVGKDVPVPLLHAITALPEEALQDRLTSLQAAEFLYEIPHLPAVTYTSSMRSSRRSPTSRCSIAPGNTSISRPLRR